MGLIFFLFILYPVNFVGLKFMYGKPLIMIATIGATVLFIGGWKLLEIHLASGSVSVLRGTAAGQYLFQTDQPDAGMVGTGRHRYFEPGA